MKELVSRVVKSLLIFCIVHSQVAWSLSEIGLPHIEVGMAEGNSCVWGIRVMPGAGLDPMVTLGTDECNPSAKVSLDKVAWKALEETSWASVSGVSDSGASRSGASGSIIVQKNAKAHDGSQTLEGVPQAQGHAPEGVSQTRVPQAGSQAFEVFSDSSITTHGKSAVTVLAPPEGLQAHGGSNRSILNTSITIEGDAFLPCGALPCTVLENRQSFYVQGTLKGVQAETLENKGTFSVQKMEGSLANLINHASLSIKQWALPFLKTLNNTGVINLEQGLVKVGQLINNGLLALNGQPWGIVSSSSPRLLVKEAQYALNEPARQITITGNRLETGQAVRETVSYPGFVPLSHSVIFTPIWHEWRFGLMSFVGMQKVFPVLNGLMLSSSPQGAGTIEAKDHVYVDRFKLYENGHKVHIKGAKKVLVLREHPDHLYLKNLMPDYTTGPGPGQGIDVVTTASMMFIPRKVLDMTLLCLNGDIRFDLWKPEDRAFEAHRLTIMGRDIDLGNPSRPDDMVTLNVNTDFTVFGADVDACCIKASVGGGTSFYVQHAFRLGRLLSNNIKLHSWDKTHLEHYSFLKKTAFLEDTQESQESAIRESFCKRRGSNFGFLGDGLFGGGFFFDHQDLFCDHNLQRKVTASASGGCGDFNLHDRDLIVLLGPRSKRLNEQYCLRKTRNSRSEWSIRDNIDEFYPGLPEFMEIPYRHDGFETFRKNGAFLAVGGDLTIRNGGDYFQEGGDILSGGSIDINNGNGLMRITSANMESKTRDITIKGTRSFELTRPLPGRYWGLRYTNDCQTNQQHKDYVSAPGSIIQAMGDAVVRFPSVRVYGSSILSTNGNVDVQAPHQEVKHYHLYEGDFSYCISCECPHNRPYAQRNVYHTQASVIRGHEAGRLHGKAIQMSGTVVGTYVSIYGSQKLSFINPIPRQPSASILIHIEEWLQGQAPSYIQKGPDGVWRYPSIMSADRQYVIPFSSMPYIGSPCFNPTLSVAPDVLDSIVSRFLMQHGFVPQAPRDAPQGSETLPALNALVGQSRQVGAVALPSGPQFDHPLLYLQYTKSPHYNCFVHPYFYFPASDGCVNEGGCVQAMQRVDIQSNKLTLEGNSVLSGGDIDIKARNIIRKPGVTQVTTSHGGHTVTKEIVTPQTVVAKDTVTMTAQDNYDSRGSFTFGNNGINIEAVNIKATGHIETITDLYCWTKKGNFWKTDKQGCETKVSHKFYPDVYIASQGTILKKAQAQIVQIGSRTQAQHVIFDASTLSVKAIDALDKFSQTIQKDGTFTSSSSSEHKEELKVQPSTLQAHGITLIGDVARFEGVVIEAGVVEKKVKTLSISPSPKKEACWTRSHARASGLGWSETEAQGCQEQVIPSILMIEKFRDEKEGQIIFKGVQAKIEEFIAKSDFMQESPLLRSWSRSSSSSGGIVVPAVENKGMPPIVSAVQAAVTAPSNEMDQVAVLTRLASQMVHDARIAHAFWSSPTGGGLAVMINGKAFSPWEAILAQYTNIAFSYQQSRTSQEATVPLMGSMEGKWFEVVNEQTHLEGRNVFEKAIIQTKELSILSAVETRLFKASHEEGSVSFNVLTGSFGVSGGGGSSTQQEEQHHKSTLEAEELYIQTDNMLIRGSQVIAGLVECIATGMVRVESVLDTFHLEHESFGTSLSTDSLPDLRIEDTDKIKKWINTVAAFVGTKRFLLTVGQQLSLVSAQVGLSPSGTITKPLSQKEVEDALANNGEGQQIKAKDTRVTILQEVDEEEGFVLNLPLGSLQALWQETQALHQQIKTAQFQERAREWIKQEEVTPSRDEEPQARGREGPDEHEFTAEYFAEEFRKIEQEMDDLLREDERIKVFHPEEDASKPHKPTPSHKGPSKTSSRKPEETAPSANSGSEYRAKCLSIMACGGERYSSPSSVEHHEEARSVLAQKPFSQPKSPNVGFMPSFLSKAAQAYRDSIQWMEDNPEAMKVAHMTMETMQVAGYGLGAFAGGILGSAIGPVGTCVGAACGAGIVYSLEEPLAQAMEALGPKVYEALVSWALSQTKDLQEAQDATRMIIASGALFGLVANPRSGLQSLIPHETMLRYEKVFSKEKVKNYPQNLPGPQFGKDRAFEAALEKAFRAGTAKSRKLEANERFVRYHAKNKRTGEEVTWLTKTKYASDIEIRQNLGILDEWSDIKFVTDYELPAGSWIREGVSAPQGKYPGGGYQAIIRNQEVSAAKILKTTRRKD